MCAFLLAVGIIAFRNERVFFLDQFDVLSPGISIIALSCILFCLNLIDGIMHISKFKYNRILILAVIAFYLFLSLRTIELAVDLRLF